MRSVLRLKIAFLLFTILITACVIGCSEDGEDFEIYGMSIEAVNVFVAETEHRQLFSVIVWVYGVAGPNLCYEHHKTDYLQRDDYAGHPLYSSGDTIHISISASGATGFGFCFDEVSMHEEAIFVGFCVPGEYTLRVNDFTKAFRVGSGL